ncbi:MAG: acyl-ACP--UDP-N-acetylglucosamine O-acyltransferase [bacterium]
MSTIHPSAIIDHEAQIDESVTIGPYVVIGGNVKIAKDTVIGAHAHIAGWTDIAEECVIGPHAVIGTEPQDLKFKGEESYLTIGRHTKIREFANINRGTAQGGGRTVIKENCLIMAYVHIAHDCQVGNNVILSNAVTFGGHVHVEDYAIIGGLTAVHQFIKIGEYAFVGGCSAVAMDIPPYAKAVGNRARLFGINSVGLQRNQFNPDEITLIKKAYRFLMSSKLNVSQALEAIKGLERIDKIDKIISFIEASERGICRR